MSKAKHTVEPWEWTEGTPNITRPWNNVDVLLASVERPAWHEDQNKASEEAGANAARIVACVNGCEGINPEAVKDLLVACGLLLSMPLPVTRTRQEQLNRKSYQDVALAAIAKAKGE